MIKQLALAGLVLTTLAGCEYREACNSQAKGFDAAKDAVTSRLKAPATAVFPKWNDTSVQIHTLGECKFSVSGYVDSQNGFGAMIRSKFTTTVEFSRENSEWLASDMIIR